MKMIKLSIEVEVPEAFQTNVSKEIPTLSDKDKFQEWVGDWVKDSLSELIADNLSDDELNEFEDSNPERY